MCSSVRAAVRATPPDRWSISSDGERAQQAHQVCQLAFVAGDNGDFK
jgi:hypothetical protein